MIKVYTDGGARGNPGPAAVGVYICDDKGNVLVQIAKTIGNTTNNVAEYTAVIEALSWILNNKEIVGQSDEVLFYLDSQLIVRQINGIYKIKSASLRNLLIAVREREMQIGKNIHYFHIPRKQNKKADALVNNALDNATKLP